jgi:hypothetical protein
MKFWISVVVALSGLMLTTLSLTYPNYETWLMIGLIPELAAWWTGFVLTGLVLFVVGTGLSVRFYLLDRRVRRARAG